MPRTWTTWRDELKPGDKVIVTVYPRSWSVHVVKELSAMYVVLEDGRKFGRSSGALKGESRSSYATEIDRWSEREVEARLKSDANADAERRLKRMRYFVKDFDYRTLDDETLLKIATMLGWQDEQKGGA
jgi:hypothetical protein